MTTVTFTPEILARFKRVYRDAVDAHSDTFMFEGKEYVVTYAKYLIEYLDGQLLDKARRQPK